MKRIAVIAGDGIGVEVTREALRVLAALRLDVSLTHFDWGAERYLRTGVAVPPGGFDELRAFDAILFGAVGDPRVPGGEHAREILLGMRFQLDLYINLRPVRLIDERFTPLKGKRPADIDMTVFRENTEGLYVGMGGNFKRGTEDEIAINEDLNSRRGVDRILRAAFEWARHNVQRTDGRKRLCMTDKANALEYAHGLWRRAFAAMQKEYPDVQASALYVDVCAMELVRAPERFDVIVTSNMFGNILTDLGAAIAGGLGLAASGNIHPGQVSLFEPVHGSAPDIVGKDLANPLGSILTLALLLEHIDEDAAAARVEAAVRGAVIAGQVTADLGGKLSTRACTDAVLEHLVHGDAAT
jgi:3-isopropylmalate dehydrogenase